MLSIIRTFILFFTLSLLATAASGKPTSSHRVDSYPVQLTVWNMTDQSIMLICKPNTGVTMPQQEYNIAPNDSPAILLTTDRFGNLVRCHIENTLAAFEYTLITETKEHVEITPLPAGQPNFHYNPSYPGALTYK